MLSVVVVFIDFVALAKLARFESAGASALHTLHLCFIPRDVRDRHLLDRGVVTAPPFIDRFVCQKVLNVLPNHGTNLHPLYY